MMERLRSLGLPGVSARTFHAHALSQLRHFWPLNHDGAPLPEILSTKLPILSRLARGLPGHYRFTPAKDLADEIEWAKSRRVQPGGLRGRGRGCAPRAAAACGPVHPGVRRLRTGEGPSRPARLRRHADRRGRSPRTRPRRRRDRPSPQTLVQRRRIPGHEPAPAAAARALGRRPAGCLRRRRRGPDDLHVHRGNVRLPDLVRRAPRRDQGDRPDRELSLEPGGPRPGEPAHRLGGPLEAADRDAPVRSAADDHPSPDRRGGARGTRRRDPDAACRRDRTRRSRRARPDECPARTDRGGPDARRDRLPGERTRVLAAAGGQEPRSTWSGRAGEGTGERLASAVRALWTKELGYEEGAASERGEAGERAAALETLASIVADLVAADPAADRGRCWPSSGDGRQRRRRRRRPASSSRRTTGRRASSGTPSSCRCSRKASCRSASRSTMTRRSRRSAGCSTSGSPAPGSTSPSRGRTSGRHEAASRAGARVASWTASCRARPVARIPICPRRAGRASCGCRMASHRRPRGRANRRCWGRCGRGERNGPGRTRFLPLSSPTIRRSPRSPRPDRSH